MDCPCGATAAGTVDRMKLSKHSRAVAVPLSNVAASMYRYRASQSLLDKAVVKARGRGATWAEIAEAAQLSSQGAHGRWAAKCDAAGVSATVVASQGAFVI